MYNKLAEGQRDIDYGVAERISNAVGVPLFAEDRCRMWIRNGVHKDKLMHRGCMIYLDGAIIGLPGKGHVGYIAHRNMQRGTLAFLRDNLRKVFGGESPVYSDSKVSRRVPKADLKSKVPERSMEEK